MNRRSVIVGFAALTVLLTAGTAQSLSGTNTVNSGDIINGQVAYVDLKDGAVTGKKVLDNSLASPDINEETLTFPTGEGTDANCTGDALGAEDCASTSITLSRPGKVYIIATFEWGADSGVTTDSTGTVGLVVDGNLVESHVVGEAGQDSQNYPMPIHDLITLGAGTHNVKVTFQQTASVILGENPDILKSHIVALRVSS